MPKEMSSAALVAAALSLATAVPAGAETAVNLRLAQVDVPAIVDCALNPGAPQCADNANSGRASETSNGAPVGEAPQQPQEAQQAPPPAPEQPAEPAEQPAPQPAEPVEQPAEQAPAPEQAPAAEQAPAPEAEPQPAPAERRQRQRPEAAPEQSQDAAPAPAQQEPQPEAVPAPAPEVEQPQAAPQPNPAARSEQRQPAAKPAAQDRSRGEDRERRRDDERSDGRDRDGRDRDGRDRDDARGDGRRGDDRRGDDGRDRRRDDDRRGDNRRDGRDDDRRRGRDDRDNTLEFSLPIPGVEGRVVIREDGQVRIRSNDDERFLGRRGRRDVERLPGGRTRVIVDRPNGVQVITVRARDGSIIRRVRRAPNGREVVLIDNERAGPIERRRDREYRRPRIEIPQDRYIVEGGSGRRDAIEEALSAPPVAPVQEAYSLEEIRRHEALRARMRRVDLSITFAFDSAAIPEDQFNDLRAIGETLAAEIDRNPAEVFLIEGHTDLPGSYDYNLRLSDARAESVAIALSDYFEVPPENLVTQGYGEEYPKIETEERERRNRRVTIRRITPLLEGRN